MWVVCWVGACMCVCSSCRSQRSISRVLPRELPTLLLEMESFSGLGLNNLARAVTIKAQGSPYPLPSAGITSMHHCAYLVMWVLG